MYICGDVFARCAASFYVNAQSLERQNRGGFDFNSYDLNHRFMFSAMRMLIWDTFLFFKSLTEQNDERSSNERLLTIVAISKFASETSFYRLKLRHFWNWF